MTVLRTQCCIAGGGPAGMMLGFLLARAGIDVIVLEKHADFLRDFRGDTIHPSTLEIMHELGLLDDLLKRPHQEVTQLEARVANRNYKVADFNHLPSRCRFIALMPQWDFLNFLAEQGKRYSGFHLHLEAAAEELMRADDGRYTGVSVQTGSGPLHVSAELVVGADGRHSTIRTQAGLETVELGAPMDVLWFRVPRRPAESSQALGRVSAGRLIVMIDRGDYWQCGFVIRKGGFDEIRNCGIEAFRSEAARLMDLTKLSDDELRGWDEVKLLTVTVDRLSRWHASGLLCIGDAAHAMSPIGGVGINLAIQDAVAAANILAPHLRAGVINGGVLQAVQARRETPVRLTQWVQLLVQRRVISGVLNSETPPEVPLILKLANRLPLMRRILARLIGLGFKPEHVRTPLAQ